MLNRKDILNKLNELHLPKGHYALGSSGVLVLNGIKEFANDLDIDVDKELFESFLSQGYSYWVYSYKNRKIIDLSDEVQLICVDKLDLENIEEIENLSVYSVDYVKAFKKDLGREKDLKDIELIDKWILSR